MVNLREARRLLAGTKKPEKPVEETKAEIKTAVAVAGAGVSVLNSMVQARMSEQLMANIDDWVLNGGQNDTPRNVNLQDWNQLLSEPSLIAQLQQIEVTSLSNPPIIQQLANRVMGFDPAQPGSERTVVRVHTTNTLARAMESARSTLTETAVEVQVRHIGRINGLLDQFNTKSEQALRREGITNGGAGVRPRDMVPGNNDLSSFFRREGGPDHVESIQAVVYWGYGDRRICIMECTMDVYNPHRGTDTNQALLAFKVRDTQNFGIQPFRGSANYNETVGFFIYQAQQGGRL
jgi:hypothetical protein